MRNAVAVAARLAACVALALGAVDVLAYAPDFCGIENSPAGYGGKAAPPSPLFPRLSLADFSKEPDSVRFRVLEHDDGRLVYESYHRRGSNLGLYARVQATGSMDAKTGLKRLTLTRQTDSCVATAAQARLAPERVCASLTATELARGAYALAFEDVEADYRLDFTLVQSRQDAGTWSMVRSGRAHEPDQLELTSTVDARGVQHTRWLVTDSTERGAFRRELGVELPLGEIAHTGFDPLESALLGGLDLLDELSDGHSDWVAYYEPVDTMEPPPGPGDEDDIYGCEPADGVCSAEYDTCVPTPDGWLGCNYEPGDVWGGPGDDIGGGFDDGDGDGDGDDDGDDVDTPNPQPDWMVGSIATDPKFARPKFHGLHQHEVNGNPVNGLSYDFVSVLQKADTHSKEFTPSSGSPFQSGHVVRIYLTDDSGNEICDLTNVGIYDFPTPILMKDAKDWRSPDDRCPRDAVRSNCVLPKSGVYTLYYQVDPRNMWDEGPGEGNNHGTFKPPVYLHD